MQQQKKRYNIKEDNLLNIENLKELVATGTKMFYQSDSIHTKAKVG